MNVSAVMFPTLCVFLFLFDRTLWSLLVQRAGSTSLIWRLPLRVKQIHPVSTSSCPLMTRSRFSPNIFLPTPKSSLLVISVNPGFTSSYIITCSGWIWLQRVHVWTVDGDGRSELVVGYTDRVVRAFRWEEPSDGSDLGSGQLVLLKKWLLEGQVHFTSPHNVFCLFVAYWTTAGAYINYYLNICEVHVLKGLNRVWFYTHSSGSLRALNE